MKINNLYNLVICKCFSLNKYLNLKRVNKYYKYKIKNKVFNINHYLNF